MADGGDVAGLAQTARRGAVLLSLTLALIFAASHAGAAKTLADFLAEVAPADVIPGGASFGTAEGEPPLVPVLDAGGERLGWAYLNTDFTTSIGYSGKPIRIVVGIDEDGKVRGLKLVEHHEPIVLVGIPEAKIMAALNDLIDQDLGAVAAGTAKPPQVDIVSGATVTVLVMGDSVVRSAVKLIRSGRLSGATSAGAAPAAAKRALDPAKTEVRDWQSLIGDGSVRSLQLTVGEVSQAFQDAGQPAAAGHPESAEPRGSLHRALRRAGLRAGDRPQPARRRRLRATRREACARAGRTAHRRRRRLFLQGLGLRPRRHLRPDRTASRTVRASASATATTPG